MCQSPLHQFLHKLPKCEHHVHLEGCLSPALLFQLAAKHNVPLPEDPAFSSAAALDDRYTRFTSLDDFLHYYYLGLSVVLDASDFEELAFAYFTRAHADGVHHAEVFFDPQSHTSRGVAYDTVVSGYSAAQRRAEREFGITTKLILCFLRHLPSSEADAVFAVADARGDFDTGIVNGIGLDSSEVGFRPELFKNVYAAAKAKGIHRTAHAAEEGDASYARSALDELSVQRIDHGLRIHEDAELMAYVAREQILLTLCPLSNVRLQCVQSVAELPIRKFLDAGVHFSVNSDDPAYFGGYILDNYCAMQEHHNLSVADWKFIAEAGVKGSWISQERREELLSKVQECVETYGKDL